MSTRATILNATLAAMVFLPSIASDAVAQQSTVAKALAKAIVKALGDDAAAFGGEAVAEQTVRRLLNEAAHTGGQAGEALAERQLRRVLASENPAATVALKEISGRNLPLLDGVVADDALPLAVGALARKSVAETLQAIETPALQRAALRAELRLPGAGAKLVKHYGDEGTRLGRTLNLDQANSLLGALRPNAVNAMPASERSKLLSVLESRPDAVLRNLDTISGPLVVVAGGAVLWHGTDVVLEPAERVIERPDGTVIRERTSLGARAVRGATSVGLGFAESLKWTGIALAVVLGITIAAALLLKLRAGRVALRRRATAPPDVRDGM